MAPWHFLKTRYRAFSKSAELMIESHKRSSCLEWLSTTKLEVFTCKLGFPGGARGKQSAYQCRRCKRHGLDPWVRKIPWRRKWQPTLVFLPGKSHGQRRLGGYSPWGHKESGTTEQLESENKSRSVVSDSLWPRGLYSPWNSPGQNTGVGSLFLQGIFPAQGSNHGFPHCRWILNQLSHREA